MSHTKWQCKYHVIFIPKCRRKTMYGVMRKRLGEVFHQLARQKECEIEEGHIMPDHVHMLISIPPKYAVSSVVGYIKGKSAIHIARHFCGRTRNYAGQSFWARGYFVDSVGLDSEMIRNYIRHQEDRDRRDDQMELPGTNQKDNNSE
jgi:putative transposase